MNYQLFSSLSASEINDTKTLINFIIDQNYKQTVLDKEKQADYDNAKYILSELNIALAIRQPLILKLA